jgi:hypothetical protein
MSKENNYIKFQCSKGLHVLTAPKRFAGKKGRCLSCYEELTIPNRTPDDFIPPPQNLSDDNAEDYEKYLADNYSDSDSVRFEQTLNPGDLSVKANCGRCKEAFTFCSSLPDPRKGNFTLFELDKLKKLPKNFDTRFYCIDCLTEFFRGSHTSRPSQEEISQSPGLSYEVDGKTYLKPLGEGLKQRIPARPESEVLAERNKKQEPLSNDNKRTDFVFFRQTFNQQSESRSILPAKLKLLLTISYSFFALVGLVAIVIGVLISKNNKIDTATETFFLLTAVISVCLSILFGLLRWLAREKNKQSFFPEFSAMKKPLGLALLSGGLWFIFLSQTMDTTVDVPGFSGTRVVNLKLNSERQNYLILGGFLLVGGIVLLNVPE